MYKKETLQESPFSNTYGGLSLVLGEDGNRYLEMKDYDGPDYYGPLNEEQATAFVVLCDVRRA